MWWQIGMVCNAVISIVYFLIVLAIAIPLIQSGQLRSNPLGAATATIFFTCAVHHGAHTLHMLLPYWGVDDTQGLAMRTAWGWQLALWDLVGATVGVYYWTLRRNYGSLMQGAKLFEDLRQREQQALEINDNVLQGLVVARMALDLDQPAKAISALDTAIGSASHMITELLGNDRAISAGLLRSAPALVADEPVRGTEPTGATEGPGQQSA
jgi:hypothetical protein